MYYDHGERVWLDDAYFSKLDHRTECMDVYACNLTIDSTLGTDDY